MAAVAPVPSSRFAKTRPRGRAEPPNALPVHDGGVAPTPSTHAAKIRPGGRAEPPNALRARLRRWRKRARTAYRRWGATPRWLRFAIITLSILVVFSATNVIY